MSAPRIAVTMGDPAGIGPEVVVRACNALDDHDDIQSVQGSLARELVRQAHADG